MVGNGDLFHGREGVRAIFPLLEKSTEGKMGGKAFAEKLGMGSA
jgi:hypothetical protein